MKLSLLATWRAQGESRPAGARGLKQAAEALCAAEHLVAPRRGAWIETAVAITRAEAMTSRAPQGRVD